MQQIEGFQNYFITESGMVYNSARGAYLKPFKDQDGYLEVRLGAGNKRKVHRLVAQAFIPNPFNKPVVNHKRGIKSDNRASELEWATHSENAKHAWATGLVKSTEKHRQSTKERTRKNCSSPNYRCLLRIGFGSLFLFRH